MRLLSKWQVVKIHVHTIPDVTTLLVTLHPLHVLLFIETDELISSSGSVCGQVKGLDHKYQFNIEPSSKGYISMTH